MFLPTQGKSHTSTEGDVYGGVHSNKIADKLNANQ
jgi:hypothetical protein